MVFSLNKQNTQCVLYAVQRENEKITQGFCRGPDVKSETTLTDFSWKIESSSKRPRAAAEAKTGSELCLFRGLALQSNSIRVSEREGTSEVTWVCLAAGTQLLIGQSSPTISGGGLLDSGAGIQNSPNVSQFGPFWSSLPTNPLSSLTFLLQAPASTWQVLSALKCGCRTLFLTTSVTLTLLRNLPNASMAFEVLHALLCLPILFHFLSHIFYYISINSPLSCTFYGGWDLCVSMPAAFCLGHSVLPPGCSTSPLPKRMPVPLGWAKGPVFPHGTAYVYLSKGISSFKEISFEG